MARGPGRTSKQVEAERGDAVVDDNAVAVEQAAAARRDGTGPGSVTDQSGHDDADAGDALPGGLSWEQVNQVAEEQLAEAIAQTSSDGEGLEGSPEDTVAAAKDKSDRYSDWITGGDADAPQSPQEQAGTEGAAQERLTPGADARAAAIADIEASGGAEDVYGNKIDLDATPTLNPVSNAPASDPLSSFVDAFETKTGRDSGLASPDEEKDTTPTLGKDGIAAPTDYTYMKVAPGSYNPDGSYNGHKEFHYFTIDKEAGLVTIVSEPVSDEGSAWTFVYDANTGEGVLINPDGSTVNTHPDGSTTKGDPPPKSDTGSVEQPDPDNEGASIPDDIQQQLDGELARLRDLRNQGPDSGDGATDPSEIESEVVGPAGELESHAAQGRRLFGQPDTENEIGGGAPPANPGADSQGAGVITPGDDQTLAGGARRDDDPFDAAAPAPEPAAEPDADAGASLLPPPSEIDSPVDAPGDDLPDVVFDELAP